MVREPWGGGIPASNTCHHLPHQAAPATAARRGSALKRLDFLSPVPRPVASPPGFLPVETGLWRAWARGLLVYRTKDGHQLASERAGCLLLCCCRRPQQPLQPPASGFTVWVQVFWVLAGSVVSILSASAHPMEGLNITLCTRWCSVCASGTLPSACLNSSFILTVRGRWNLPPSLPHERELH